MPKELSGIFTPLLIPYNTKGGIDEEELHRLVTWLIGKGVHGLYPNGSTSEFTRLTALERGIL